MTELPDSAAAAAVSAAVEPLARPAVGKESQSRESSFSGLSPRPPEQAVDGASSPPQAPSIPTPLLTKQVSSGVASPHTPGATLPCRGSLLGRHHEGDAGLSCVAVTGPLKRSPIKVGYLFKQSSGSWKRRRWNQRWFVLDNETGILKYFRHESLPEAVPFRQDAHGVIHLKEPGASLVIQGDLPRNVPTPFCFTASDGSRSFLICADTNVEFREWTSAISAILSPRKASTADVAAPLSPCFPSMRATTDSELDSTVTLAHAMPSIVADDSRTLSPKSDRPQITRTSSRMRISDPPRSADVDDDATRPTLRQTLAALLVLNPTFAIVRYGSEELLYTALFAINGFLVWFLWFKAPPSAVSSPTRTDVDELGSTCDGASSSSADLGGSLASGSLHGNPGSAKSPLVDSPRKATLPRIEKLPSTSCQQTKFLGLVDGAKVKAGDSVKMCPPAPAAIVAGCWTHISGTRFQVRLGPNYRKTKLKAPSEESLLELVAVDIYRSPSKIDNIASIIDLGELKPEDLPLDLFIVNCQVPSYQPSNPLWGEKQGNGEGFNFVSYFAISPAIREQLREHEPGQQAVRLLKNFMQDNSSVRDRFKAIGIVVNPQEQKLGRTERHLLETYNGQPILTRPQHRFFRGDGYFEVDVDAHEFNFVARKGLVGVSEHFRNMVVDFGYVIEGQEDAELPEQMLGAVRLCKIDVRQALEIA